VKKGKGKEKGGSNVDEIRDNGTFEDNTEGTELSRS
jgi:hypothetical protein